MCSVCLYNILFLCKIIYSLCFYNILYQYLSIIYIHIIVYMKHHVHIYIYIYITYIYIYTLDTHTHTHTSLDFCRFLASHGFFRYERPSNKVRMQRGASKILGRGGSRSIQPAEVKDAFGRRDDDADGAKRRWDNG